MVAPMGMSSARDQHPHKAVQSDAGLSGPGKATVSKTGTGFSSVLDSTVPGRLQRRDGSYAEFPFPPRSRTARSAFIAGPGQPCRTREASGDLVTPATSRLMLPASCFARTRDRPNPAADRRHALVFRSWYARKCEASIELKRLDGKIDAHRTIGAATGAHRQIRQTAACHVRIGPSDRRCTPSTQDRFADAPSDQTIAQSVAEWHAGKTAAAIRLGKLEILR